MELCTLQQLTLPLHIRRSKALSWSQHLGNGITKINSRNSCNFRKGVCRAVLDGSDGDTAISDPFKVLNVPPGSSADEVKAAFRAKIKQYHPDVYQGELDAEAMTISIVQAYEELTIKIENETNTFQFAGETQRARVQMQDAGARDDDYIVFLAVGQCPQLCIHYLTLDQAKTAEAILGQVVNGTRSIQEVATALDGFIASSKYDNGRQSGKKRTPQESTEWVDWF